MFKIIAPVFLLLPSLLFANQDKDTECHADISKSQLLALKDEGFTVASEQKRNNLALTLLNCIGHPDPKIRDGIVYEASRHWLRKELLTTQTVELMFEHLVKQLSLPVEKDKAQGTGNFAQPFAALILSEVVRVDRVTPYLTAAQRIALVDNVVSFMQTIKDYRGFDENDGWRHSVAHTADVLLQLALNKNITQAQLQQMLGAINHQVSPENGHFYIYGEPKRLAMPFVYIALRKELSSQDIIGYLEQVALPAPYKDWDSVYTDNPGLAKLHNTRAFIYSLMAITGNSENPKLKAIQPTLGQIIRKIG